MTCCTRPKNHPAATTLAPHEDLRAALEILADLTGHPEAAVAAAARTVLRLTPNAEHSNEAFKALRMLDQLELIP